MRVTLLGTGASSGMPLYGCDCRLCACARANAALVRRNASALLETQGKRLLIDAGLMDLCERFPAGSIDGILLTHFHPDHVQGLFHLRWGVGKKIPVYCPPDSQGCADLFKHPGLLEFIPLERFKPFSFGAIDVTPVPLIHSKATFGYCFEYGDASMAYLTDTCGLPPKTHTLLERRGLDVMVIDTTALPGQSGTNHNNLDDSISLHHQLGVKHTVLTHIGHDLDCWLSDHPDTLPAGVTIGYDGAIVFERIG